ncbi:MAG: ribose-phosphate diphosphokinase [Thermoplasmatales archaeon B_DKE]|nr:MAG: ribose-phosphate diphosphokinase [Thermoplasmatales archaeon B_DKE]
MIVVAGSSSGILAQKISQYTGSDIAEVERKKFPDGELYLRVNGNIRGCDVILVSNTRSNENIIETMLLLDAVKECEPHSLTAVIPYFGYARQHMRYKDGEPVSSKVWTYLIERFADTIVSVDIHDEQTLSYSSKPFMNISIVDSIASHYAGKNINYVISPDDGGSQRAMKIAAMLGTKHFYIDKKRIDSNTVEMRIPDVDLRGKNVLIVDDIISTGGTIVKAVKLIREMGAAKIYVSAVHGIFTGDSENTIKSIADDLAVTDTIESGSSKISVAKEIVDGIGVKSI